MERILSPTNDYVFKRIFGHNKNFFINFVNSIFSDKNEIIVSDVAFLNTEITKDIINGKQGRLDVKAKLANGSYINIEIQVEKSDDFKKRSLFYWAKMYGEQAKESQFYADLKPCVCINVLDFDLFKKKEYHTLIRALDVDNHDCIFSEFEIHFLELGKFAKNCYDKKSLFEMSMLEKWMLFIKNPNEKILKELEMTHPIFAEAKETLYYLSQDQKERDLADAREKFLMDQRSSINAAKQQGIQQGIQQEKYKNAKKLKDFGVAFDVIAKATDLNIEEIENL